MSRQVVLVTMVVFTHLACGPAAPPPTDPVADDPSPDPVATSDPTGSLSSALTFHASFDASIDAAFARGDGRLHSAASYDVQESAVPGLGDTDVEVAVGAGRFGNALRFNSRNQQAVFYPAADNVAYAPDGWNGTVSFWLSVDPATDLEPGFCDPIQITDTAYNDGAVWVDFTAENPRQFRLGVFGDLAVWNPDGLPPTDPLFLERLVVVDEPPFGGDQWTHVVITFSGLNEDTGGEARLYLNGEPQGPATTGLDEPFSWDLARGAIRLGVNYVGLLDELSLFDRALDETEVRMVYQLAGGMSTLLP